MYKTCPQQQVLLTRNAFFKRLKREENETL